MSPPSLLLSSENDLGDGMIHGSDPAAEPEQRLHGPQAGAGTALPNPPPLPSCLTCWTSLGKLAFVGPVLPGERSKDHSEPLGMYWRSPLAATYPCKLLLPLLWSSIPALPGVKLRASGNTSRKTEAFATTLFPGLHFGKGTRRVAV